MTDGGSAAQAAFPCLVCGANAVRVIYPATVSNSDTESARNYIPTYNLSNAHAEIGRCGSCGFMTVTRPLPQAVFDRLYGDMEDPRYLDEAAAYRPSFQFVLDRLERFRTPGARLLEVGAGAGFFLEEARARGWQVRGVEPSRWMVTQADSRLGAGTVTRGGYTDARFDAGAFDVIVAIHVVEHVADPAHFLATLRPWLREGGVLFLITPDAGSLLARILGEKWWYVQIPHLHYFTARTIRRLLEKQGYRGVASAKYPRFVTKDIVENRIAFFPALLRPLTRLVFVPVTRWGWRLKVHTGDQIMVSALKA